MAFAVGNGASLHHLFAFQSDVKDCTPFYLATVPLPAPGNMHGKILGDRGLAATGNAVPGAAVPCPEQALHKPILPACSLHFSVEEEF